MRFVLAKTVEPGAHQTSFRNNLVCGKIFDRLGSLRREGLVAKSILIVEDEPFILEALTYLLEREGLDVSSHSDGKGCVEKVLLKKPDLVILDIMLPSVSGMQILEELRAFEETKSLPVLMLTAKGQKKDRLAAEEAGASLFMTKPFSNEEIVNSVWALIGR